MPPFPLQERLDPSTRTGVFLASPTKGKMELIVGNEWVMAEEDLPELSWIPGTAYMGEEQRLVLRAMPRPTRNVGDTLSVDSACFFSPSQRW